MILRLVRGRADRAQLEAYRAALDAALGPASGETGGPLRWHLAARGEDDALEVLATASWASAESVALADARGTTVWRLAERHLDDARVEHFEVDESLLRHSGSEPIAIRVATGRFTSHGADIEMQALLRARMPEIGDDMCEAYVGRRFAGRSIEVTFVSAWQRVPEDRSLEAPFWTDIALRYDSFAVEVYEIVR